MNVFDLPNLRYVRRILMLLLCFLQDSKGVEDFGDVIRDGGGALAKGIFRGVTGILTKPIEGAKSSGVEGLFKELERE